MISLEFLRLGDLKREVPATFKLLVLGIVGPSRVGAENVTRQGQIFRDEGVKVSRSFAQLSTL